MKSIHTTLKLNILIENYLNRSRTQIENADLSHIKPSPVRITTQQINSLELQHLQLGRMAGSSRLILPNSYPVLQSVAFVDNC